MNTKDCVAMILAGGQGSRLGALTKCIAKPAIQYGGKYRIVDFPLSNCVYSGIDTIGVLTQYEPLVLNSYIGSGTAWDLDRTRGGVFVLPPYQSARRGEWYKGTANAIYQNITFLERYKPKNVLILSGDHIYKMHYGKMLDAHKKSGAAITISVMPVAWEDAGRFGIMNVSENGRITEFEEKPKNPKSNLASMGIYIFDYDILKKYLADDEKNPESSNDFGKNIIPSMLANNEKMYAWEFNDYWKDVGTVNSLWEANMDLLDIPPKFQVRDDLWNICSSNTSLAPNYIGRNAKIVNSSITDGGEIDGKIIHSVISSGVVIKKGAVIKDSVIMSGVIIGENTVVEKAVIGENAKIGANCRIGTDSICNNKYASELCCDNIVLVEGGTAIESNSIIPTGSMIENK